ncbi:MAG: 4-hydroxy-tetrahydrodipicolinate reductase, partial [Deltaproteobacteria bacterium]
MARLGIFGANGRVGKTILQEASSFENLELGVAFSKAHFESNIEGLLVTNSIDEFVKKSDIIIDFSSPQGTLSLLEKALEYAPKRLVIGTTGLNEHTQNLIKEASKNASVFYASNMSLGIAVLQKIVYEASKALADFDIEIVEMHHRHKKDAPSGTALNLAEIAATARGLDLDEV